MERVAAPRTRFAPSPTGDLHLGGALCALASFWLAYRSEGAERGVMIVRMEDLDPPRVVAGSATRILDDLRWLGLDWTEGPGKAGPFGPYVQSQRSAHYHRAIQVLRARGLVYPCDCSRAEIARVASAPHAGEELVYPGTCRSADPHREFKRSPALRVRAPEGETVVIHDAIAGHVEQALDRSVGDFVLVRGDGVFAYQLAVVVDDLAMEVTDVIRGDDLLSSTPRQVWLARELGARDRDETPPRSHESANAPQIPRYMHLPLVTDHEGHRLQKRSPGAHVRALREAGVSAPAIVGVLAHALGLREDDAPIDARALLSADPHSARTISPRTLAVPRGWAEAAQRVANER